MAGSLIGGLVAGGWDPKRIAVADPDSKRLAVLGNRFQVNTDTNNHRVVENADVVVLAVKPQVIHDVALDLANLVQRNQPLLVSIAAGIRAADLQRWLGGSCALVRCMPNTPALVQSGATALWRNENVNDEQIDLAETILRAVGLTVWVETEDLMDAVTALSGSGPAYFLLVMEALQETGQALGLNAETAKLLSLQTAFGAAKMALESNEDLALLRQRVTSPGGTTEKALEILETGRIRAIFSDAMHAARDRSQQLAEQFGAE